MHYYYYYYDRNDPRLNQTHATRISLTLFEPKTRNAAYEVVV